MNNRIAKRINQEVFENMASYKASYFAGVLFGDGSIGNYGKGEYVRLAMSDADVVYALASFCGLNEDDVRVYRASSAWSKRIMYSLRLHSSKIVRDLALYGVTPGKMEREFVYPQGVNDKAFILGLYDSDGSVSNKSPIWLMGNGSFASQISLRLGTFGFKTSVYLIRKDIEAKVYRVAVLTQGDNLVNFIKWIYECPEARVCSKRKFIRAYYSLLPYKRFIFNTDWAQHYANPDPSSLNPFVKVSEKEQRPVCEDMEANKQTVGGLYV